MKAEEAASRDILVPARLDETELPLRLRRIQAADLSGWQPERAHGGFQSLLLAVAGILGKPVIEPGPLPSAQEYSSQGERHEREGDLRKAAESYVRALKADANHAAAYAGLLRLVAAGSTTARREPRIGVGVVSWFNPVKGFGFVTPEAEDGPFFISLDTRSETFAFRRTALASSKSTGARRARTLVGN